MKKKSFLKFAFIVATLALTGYSEVRNNAVVRNPLLAENIEALADDLEDKPQKCTRPTFTGSCYDDKTNQWAGTYIGAVEEYYVYPGSPIICYHYKVTDCPKGTHKK